MKATFMIISLISTLISIAQDSNSHFSYTESTNASPARIWQLWTNTDLWPSWDSGLKKASLNGQFKIGSKGKITPDKGPKTIFSIKELSENSSYKLEFKIPLGKLLLERRLTVENEITYFTHEIQFTGPFKKFMGGKRYKKMLPEVMKQLKKLAEKESL